MCICMCVCLCIYDQPPGSLAHIFLWTARLNPTALEKSNILKTNPITFLSLPSLLFLTLWSELYLPYHSPKIDS